jgi:hypothetical protein
MPDLPVPSTPDVSIQTLVYTALRALLTILGTFGVSVSALSDASVLWGVAGGLSVLGSVILSFYQKFQAAHADHANSVASANAGRPLKVA